MELRLAGEEHGPGVQAIYGPIVAGTATSFEYEVPDAAEMGRRMAARWPTHPWLVAVEGDRVLGYAYAGPFSGRAAYAWSAEVSLYVHAEVRRRGVGRVLYTALFELLRVQGFAQVYAGVTLPTDASVGAHEAMGFEPVGCYRGVGWKLGAWHDVGWWQRPLGPRPAGEPAAVRTLEDLTPEEIAAALATATGPVRPS
jgi:L-amino acid N-acyltransferase YncA